MADSVTLVVEQLRRTVPGGIGVYARSLARGLASLHHTDRPEVVLHASRLPRSATSDPLLDLGFPLDRSSLPSKLLTRAWDRGWASPAVLTDAVHSTALAFPPAGRGRKLAVTVHDMAWREVPDAFPPRGRRWHEAALRRALRSADLFVVPATHVADGLVRSGTPAARIEVIEDGCDHLPPPDRVAAAALLRRAGVEGPYLLTVSTQEPRKNLPRLVAAYEQARPHLPSPWPLVVVGPQGWGPTLEVAEGVVPLGRVEDAVLAALYRGARLLAFVPLHEGFGLPAVEAMHAGIPVLASRQAVPAAGNATLAVEATDVSSIAAGLVLLATDDDLRTDRVVAGNLRAAQLTWVTVARRHAEIWKAL